MLLKHSFCYQLTVRVSVKVRRSKGMQTGFCNDIYGIIYSCISVRGVAQFGSAHGSGP